ncbi:MAG: TatD family hydrolase [Chloroflexi bacterium]|nr:TatD family hydrolase [Chloroflexota bacterium]
MTALFDTHCHLQDPGFAGSESEAVGRANDAGVAAMLVCGWDGPSNTAALELGAAHRGVFPAVGFHPHEARTVTPAMLAELESLASLPEVVCVGEIGLDFFRDHSPQDDQRRILDAQLEIAVRTGKPVSVHSRGAEDAIFSHLEAYARQSPLPAEGRPPGVMHCFGGNFEQARRYTALGFAISLACTVTYPNNREGRLLAASLPLGSLVVETDSPYLPPQAFRGKRNEPMHLRHAVEAVAALRGLTFDEVAAATTATAARIFAVAVPVAVAA